MITLYNTLLYRPLFNALIIIYNNISFLDLGIAVIILTLIIRFILFPFFHKSSRNQTIIQKIQPEISALTEKYKDNKEEQIKQIMALYKKYKVNPLSSILLLIIQLPILIALYHVFFYGLSDSNLHEYLYSFVAIPAEINANFLGLINLNESSIIIVVLAALFQYFQGRLSLPKAGSDNNNQAANIGRKMVLVAPILTLIILTPLPSVLGVYWITTSIFSIFQQFIINHSLKKSETNDRNENNL